MCLRKDDERAPGLAESVRVFKYSIGLFFHRGLVQMEISKEILNVSNSMYS